MLGYCFGDHWVSKGVRKRHVECAGWRVTSMSKGVNKKRVE